MDTNDLNEQTARVTINDDEWDEDEGLVCDENNIIAPSGESGIFLIAKVITDRPIKSGAFKAVMAGVWRPVKRMEVREIDSDLYCLQLFHDLDAERILNEGPWSFEQKMIVIDRFDMGVSPHSIPLHMVDFWGHVYDLHGCFWTEKMAQNIGNYIEFG